jgi:hypothetical protein
MELMEGSVCGYWYLVVLKDIASFDVMHCAGIKLKDSILKQYV